MNDGWMGGRFFTHIHSLTLSFSCFIHYSLPLVSVVPRDPHGGQPDQQPRADGQRLAPPQRRHEQRRRARRHRRRMPRLSAPRPHRRALRRRNGQSVSQSAKAKQKFTSGIVFDCLNE